jgi:3-deoxy-manno-octulosonate cytidylyltransferase (CMP-KDO synthetase)
MKLIIPYRLKSSRFPNKYISNFLEKPLIEHSIKLCQGLGDVIVTAPKEDYVKEVSDLHTEYKFDFIPTSLDCKTGTDRVMEISRNISDDYYVMIPADEPLILKEELKRVLYKEQLDDFNTCYTDFYCEEDCTSNLSAKIVSTWDDYLLYQSRNIIPIQKNGNFDYKKCKKQVGIKIFSQGGLRELFRCARNNTETQLDKVEGLEELRIVELGFKFKLHKIKHSGFGIDVPEQVDILEKRYNFSLCPLIFVPCGSLRSKFVNSMRNEESWDKRLEEEKKHKSNYIEELQESILSEGYDPDKNRSWIIVNSLPKGRFEVQNGNCRHKILYDNFGEDYMIKVLVVGKL